MIIEWNYEPNTLEALERLKQQEPFYSLNTIVASYGITKYKLEDMCKRGELHSERYYIDKVHMMEAIPASELYKLEAYKLREPRIVEAHQPGYLLQKLRKERNSWNS